MWEKSQKSLHIIHLLVLSIAELKAFQRNSVGSLRVQLGENHMRAVVIFYSYDISEDEN